jgi:hypothetical protein
MGMHGLFVDPTAPYYAALRAELLAFPNGKHDDQVDALGLVGQLLDVVAPGRVPAKPDKLQKFKDYAQREDTTGAQIDKAF